VTPNAGVGGNAAYESAAALANSLKVLLDSSTARPSFEAIKHALKKYEKSRIQRASALNKIANDLTRVQALKGVFERFFVFYIMPNAGDSLCDMFSEFTIGATKIDYLPPPKRSLEGTMPFNPEQGVAKRESILWRLFLVIPFFMLSAFCLNRMEVAPLNPFLPQVTEILQAGRIAWDGGSFTLPETFFHVKLLEDLMRPGTIVFAPSSFGIDPVAWWQMLSFITDLGVLYSIFLIESTRRSNKLTFAQM